MRKGGRTDGDASIFDNKAGLQRPTLLSRRSTLLRSTSRSPPFTIAHTRNPSQVSTLILEGGLAETEEKGASGLPAKRGSFYAQAEQPHEAAHRHVRFAKEHGHMVERAWDVKMRSLADCSEPSPVVPSFSAVTINGEAADREISLTREKAPIVERAWGVKVRPLAKCSEPSPVASSFLESSAEHTPRIDGLGHPSSLATLAPPVCPNFALYTLAASDVHKPSPSRELQTPKAAGQLQYPYNLAQIYGPVYPYFDLYPAIVHKVSPPCRATLPVQHCNQQRYPYSLSTLFPAVYPHFDLYPACLSIVKRPTPPSVAAKDEMVRTEREHQAHDKASEMARIERAVVPRRKPGECAKLVLRAGLNSPSNTMSDPQNHFSLPAPRSEPPTPHRASGRRS